MGATHAMLDEIREQPELMKRIWEDRRVWSKPFVELCHAHHFRRLLFVGNGSPYYAGITLRYAAERLLRVNAESIPAAVFHNHGSFDATGTIDPAEILLVCPAETGHSRGQVDAARRARALGIPVVCTTLNPEGVLARECDVVLAKLGDSEHAIAATKNQTMALFLLLTCFVEAAGALDVIDDIQYERLIAALAAGPENIAATIESTLAWTDANERRLMSASAFFLVGYGANYGTVQEAALKFYETHERPSYAFELEETLHGPFRALHQDDMLLMLSAEAGAERERMELLARCCEPFCANRVLIMSKEQAATTYGDVLPISSGGVEFVDTIEYLVPLQVIAARMSDCLGIDLTAPKVASLDPVMLPAYRD